MVILLLCGANGEVITAMRYRWQTSEPTSVYVNTFIIYAFLHSGRRCIIPGYKSILFEMYNIHVDVVSEKYPVCHSVMKGQLRTSMTGFWSFAIG